MDNQPTLKEYLNFRRGKVIMTHDGSFYQMEKQSSKKFKILSIVIPLFFFIFLVLLLSTSFWYSRVIDFFLYYQLCNYITKRLEYNHCRFERIESINEENENSIEWLQKRTNGERFRLRLLICLGIALGIALSSTALSIRSLFEIPNNISNFDISFADANGKEYSSVSDCERLSGVSIPYTTVTKIFIDVDFSGSPSSYQFKLNGQIQPNIKSLKWPSAIWDKEIFTQHYLGSLDVKDLPDNSVLEISSGSYSRKWTIKTVS